MPRLKWTRERIILQLQRLNRRNEVLTVHRMRAIGLGGMATTAYKLFGSWEAALREAGLDPTSHRLRVPWTLERIVDEVRALAVTTDALSRRRAEKLYPALVRAALRHPQLGSWRRALEAAGLDPGLHIRRRRWSAAAIVAEIQNIAAAGESLVGARVRASRPDLFAAACSRRYFGSWGRALVAAGFPDPPSLRRPPWTRTSIVQTIKTLHSQGCPLTTTWLRSHGWSSLTAAAVRSQMFGSWRDALECAGIDYDAARGKAPAPLESAARTGRVDRHG